MTEQKRLAGDTPGGVVGAQYTRLRTRLRFEAWFRELPPPEQTAVNRASEWFGSVHLLDMDSMYAVLEGFEIRLTQAEQRLSALEETGSPRS